jgi:phosphoglycolate phosphatase-like HAD superfamily hydrolase
MLVFWDIDGTLMYCGADGTDALNETFETLYGVADAFHSVGIGRAMDFTIIKKIMSTYDIPDAAFEKIEVDFVERLRRILASDERKRVLPGVRELLYYTENRGDVNALLTSNLKAGAEAKLRSVNLWEKPNASFEQTAEQTAEETAEQTAEQTADCGNDNDNDNVLWFPSGGFGDAPGEKWEAAERARKEIRVGADNGGKFDPRCRDGSSVMRQKAIEACRVVVIGDGVYDIETAKRNGYHVISVATGWTSYEELEKAAPDYLLKDLSDTEGVKQILEMIREAGSN